MNSFEQWFYEIPPITRTFGTLLFGVSILCHFGILTPFQLYFNAQLIFGKRQIWRLLTTFLYIGPLGLDFLFHVFFVLRYCRMLEEGKFRNTPEDFVMLFVFAGTLLWFISPFLDILFLASPLTFVLVYVWSRHHPNVRMSFLGLFTFTAPFLPWVLLAFSFLLHANSVPVHDILGIGIGHLYYFLTEVYPTIRPGRRWIYSPPFFKRLIRSMIFNQNAFNENENDNDVNENENAFNQNENENDNVVVNHQ